MNSSSDILDDEPLLSLAGFFRILWAGRRWIAGIAAAMAIAFGAIAFLSTPIYRGAVVVVASGVGRDAGALGKSLGDLGGIASMVGLNVGSGNEETEEALAVLKSREFTEKFLAAHDIIPLIYASKWDAQRKQWTVPAAKQPTPAKAYKYFNERIRTVTRDKKAGLITVQVEWRDRNQAADWANDLVARLNEEMRRRAITQAEASMRYLEKELETTSTMQTREAIGRLIEMQVKQRMLANVTQEYAFRVVDRAMPADADSPERPKKLRMIGLGLGLGIVLGTLVALLLHNFRPSPAGRPS